MTCEQILTDHVDEIRTSYDRLAPEYAHRIADELTYKPVDRRLLDRLAEEVGPDGEVCDLGCGPGQVARHLRRAGARVVGIDLSPKMLEEARRLNPDIQFRIGDMFALDVPADSFAGIAAFYAIVNIPEGSLAAVFEEIHRVLKPDGLLLLAFHAGREVIWEERLWDIPITMAFYLFDPATIRGLLKAAGFMVDVVVERGPYAPAVEYQSRRAYILARKASRNDSTLGDLSTSQENT